MGTRKRIDKPSLLCYNETNNHERYIPMPPAKNTITREWIEKELRFYNGADIKSSLVLCGVITLLLLPITIGLTYGIFILVKNLLIKIVSALIFLAIMCLPIGINAAMLCTALAERKLLLRGEFDVVIRDVLYKSEKLVNRHTEQMLHFQGFDEISVGSTTFQLAAEGDLFYIVHYKTKKKIRLLYSAKIYEYKK